MSNDSESSEQEYNVEKIIRCERKKNKLRFLVKWEGYDSDDNSWEPEENLSNCKILLREFMLKDSLIKHKIVVKKIELKGTHKSPRNIIKTDEKSKRTIESILSTNKNGSVPINNHLKKSKISSPAKNCSFPIKNDLKKSKIFCPAKNASLIENNDLKKKSKISSPAQNCSFPIKNDLKKSKIFSPAKNASLIENNDQKKSKISSPSKNSSYTIIFDQKKSEISSAAKNGNVNIKDNLCKTKISSCAKNSNIIVKDDLNKSQLSSLAQNGSTTAKADLTKSKFSSTNKRLKSLGTTKNKECQVFVDSSDSLSDTPILVKSLSLIKKSETTDEEKFQLKQYSREDLLKMFTGDNHGFSHNYAAKSIIGATMKDNEYYLLVQFKEHEVPQFVKNSVVRMLDPQLILDFYEEKVSFTK